MCRPCGAAEVYCFFVLEPKVFDYIDGDETQWEREPLERLSRDSQLMAYHHTSFWQCMDTLRDKKLLETLWESGNPPWGVAKNCDKGSKDLRRRRAG